VYREKQKKLALRFMGERMDEWSMGVCVDGKGEEVNGERGNPIATEAAGDQAQNVLVRVPGGGAIYHCNFTLIDNPIYTNITRISEKPRFCWGFCMFLVDIGVIMRRAPRNPLCINALWVGIGYIDNL
jgi:hypothetical protein